MSPLPRLQHLLVDLDGTLLESRDRAVRLEFIARTIGELRRRGGVLRAMRALGAVREAIEAPNAARDRTNAVRAVEGFARAMGIGLDEADSLLRTHVAEVFPRLERHFWPVEGAREFLDWAAPRYSLRLATNPVWPLEQVEMRVRWAGIDPGVFCSVTHSGRMHACKPSGSYYLELLEQECLVPEDCLLIGDDTRKDLPATRVGIPVFILTGRGARQPRPAAEIRPLEIEGMKAKAWAGSYEQLREMLS